MLDQLMICVKVAALVFYQFQITRYFYFHRWTYCRSIHSTDVNVSEDTKMLSYKQLELYVCEISIKMSLFSTFLDRFHLNNIS